jgi:hypothetical protein
MFAKNIDFGCLDAILDRITRRSLLYPEHKYVARCEDCSHAPKYDDRDNSCGRKVARCATVSFPCSTHPTRKARRDGHGAVHNL